MNQPVRLRRFYVPVESTDINAPTTGAEIVFQANLDKGTNKTVSADISALAKGLYRVGLEIIGNGKTLKVYSQGTIELTDLPEPEFKNPTRILCLYRANTLRFSPAWAPLKTGPVAPVLCRKPHPHKRCPHRSAWHGDQYGVRQRREHQLEYFRSTIRHIPPWYFQYRHRTIDRSGRSCRKFR